MDRLLSMRVFTRVVDEGGFAAAARVLDMSPPVVTRLVADLEDHLGTRLLQRTTRRVSLTEAGQLYVNRVRSILQDIDEAHEVTSLSTNELSGVLRLHATPVLATHMLAPQVAEFRRLHPGIVLDVTVDATMTPPIEDFDITLMAVDSSYDGDVVARKLIESDVILVASPAYLKRHGTPKEPDELKLHQTLRIKVPLGRIQCTRLWKPDAPRRVVEVETQAVLQANHFDTLLRAALDGVGIVPASVDLVAAHLARGELVRVLSPWIVGRLAIYAAMPSRKYVPQRSKVLLDFLVDEAQRQSAQALKALTVPPRKR
jgi:DNA-binding transcriptional LysR family regulator